jgi:hypothetical protein
VRHSTQGGRWRARRECPNGSVGVFDRRTVRLVLTSRKALVAAKNRARWICGVGPQPAVGREVAGKCWRFHTCKELLVNQLAPLSSSNTSPIDLSRLDLALEPTFSSFPAAAAAAADGVESFKDESSAILGNWPGASDRNDGLGVNKVGPLVWAGAVAAVWALEKILDGVQDIVVEALKPKPEKPEQTAQPVDNGGVIITPIPPKG